MSTQSPSTIQQTAAVLIRVNRQISSFLDIHESTFSKKDPFLQNGYSPLYQISIETESFVKMLIKRVNDGEKNYEAQLQKLEDRQRKHAKNHCQMKLYCEFLEQQLRNQKKSKKQYQNQLECLTVEYNKKIQTLKTQLSNAMITRANEQRPIDSRRDSERQSDTLSKIKRRLLNIGNVQMSEPISCINTVRDTCEEIVQNQVVHPFSQPNSFHNSPISNAKKQEIIKQVKMKKNTQKEIKIKRKSCSKAQLSRQKSNSQSKLKNFKKK